MPIELYTPDALVYKFFPLRNNIFRFKIRASNDAHLALTAEPRESHPIIEVFIGGWQNTKTVIRYNQTKPEIAEAKTPRILSPNEFRGFWVRVNNGILTVGRGGGSAPFLTSRYPQSFAINYVGVCTGWGASGSWIIEDSQQEHGLEQSPIIQELSAQMHGSVTPQSGPATWVPASNGQVSAGSVEGGRDGEPLFVARAYHADDLIPGKLVPSHGVTYVSYGGREHGYRSYEVLVGGRSRWVQTQRNQIPQNAIPGGRTSNGETLYIGRAPHRGTVTIGKVHRSHGVCYIPYGGQEISFRSYEILVFSTDYSPNHSPDLMLPRQQQSPMQSAPARPLFRTTLTTSVTSAPAASEAASAPAASAPPVSTPVAANSTAIPTPAAPSGSAPLCAICQDDLLSRSPMSLPCNHVLCSPCVYQLLEFQQACPVCRQRIPSIQACKPIYFP